MYPQSKDCIVQVVLLLTFRRRGKTLSAKKFNEMEVTA